MILDDVFVSEMTSHWQSLGNCVSPELQAVWRQMCHTLNEQAQTRDSRWRVLQPATGTGKSQGLALYSALHKDQPQIGILIVVRLKSQADEMAELINRLAGSQIARSRHTDSPLSDKDMATTQVLVVTHKAYEISLNKYKQGSEQQFSSFMAYEGRFGYQRQLVVIDECLDIVRQYQVDLEDLKFTLGVIPQELRNATQHAKQFEMLESLKDTLMSLTQSDNKSERVLSQCTQNVPDTESLDALRSDCACIKWDEVVIGVEFPTERQRLAKRIDRTLEASQATIEQWHFYSKKGSRHTLNTSTLVIPDDATGAVILDATASQNLLYRLFADKVDIKPVIEARSYQNVVLHIGRSKAVGKNSMKQNPQTRVAKLVEDLSERLPVSSKVFVCSHKDVEHHIAQYETPFELRTGHWGAIDGLNIYQDCDTFVCFGLPYRDRISTTNTVFAIDGPKDDEWLKNSKNRESHGFADIRQAVEFGQVTSDVIQAINRIRVRRVIDEDGNCEPANCYLLLGKDKLSDHIVDSIRRAMPGIKIRSWDLKIDPDKERSTANRKCHRSKYADSLCLFLQGRQCQRVTASFVRQYLCIPQERWKDLTRQMRNPRALLYRRLTDMGYQYITEGSRSYLAKT